MTGNEVFIWIERYGLPTVLCVAMMVLNWKLFMLYVAQQRLITAALTLNAKVMGRLSRNGGQK